MTDKGIEEKIQNTVNKAFENCWIDERSNIAHVHKLRIEELVQALTKLVEGEVRGFVKYMADHQRTDFYIDELLERYLSTLSPEQEGNNATQK